MPQLILCANAAACTACLASWLSTHNWTALLSFLVSVCAGILAWRLSRRVLSVEHARQVAVTESNELLSVQRHAFGNKLQVILGLIQLGRSDRAQEYIKGLDLRALSERAEGMGPGGQS